MRLWTLHPQMLDRMGLLAVWREGLLAQVVLNKQTTAYRNHPQLERFKTGDLEAIGAYLYHIHLEAKRRGYSFNRLRILDTTNTDFKMEATLDQILYEDKHLARKLMERDPDKYAENVRRIIPLVHPIFIPVRGPIASWERVSGS